MEQATQIDTCFYLFKPQEETIDRKTFWGGYKRQKRVQERKEYSVLSMICKQVAACVSTIYGSGKGENVPCVLYLLI